jgi:hypothetical protein
VHHLVAETIRNAPMPITPAEYIWELNFQFERRVINLRSLYSWAGYGVSYPERCCDM